MDISALQKARYSYTPKLPPALAMPFTDLRFSLLEQNNFRAPTEIQDFFPHGYTAKIAQFSQQASSNAAKITLGMPITLGVVLSGGQAPGGHNVITGLYDAVKKSCPQSKLLGFRKGPSGLLNADYIVLDDATIDRYRNTGGFDIIGSGRTKIETEEQFADAKSSAEKLGLTAIVVIGGDDSNTNAALLAEYFAREGLKTQVIGVPKTIDGDLKNEFIETSFGFDTAVKTYSELIGNIMRDANSSKKYWHFIKLMGRSASHITLEAALQTRPNIAIISEEVAAKKLTICGLVDQIADVIQRRSEMGENYGIVLIPEGLIEFIPEVRTLISELNDLLAEYKDYFPQIRTFEDKTEFVGGKLSDHSSKVFSSLPIGIRKQLLLDRDPHGNVQVSLIETEKLFLEMVGETLAERKSMGKFSGKFASQSHFFGYEGRCAFPSNFDADYTYCLGSTAFLLIAAGLSGYMSCVQNLAQPVSQWKLGGVPISMFMNLEQRHGTMKPVIRKALVELDGPAFQTFAGQRERWELHSNYLCPGAIQYFGPPEVCDQPCITLKLESNSS